jgi:hypothetical protein
MFRPLICQFWTEHHIFIIIFNPVLAFKWYLFLSLFRILMYLGIWVVNSLLSAPDDETCSAFLYLYKYTFLSAGVLTRSFCVLLVTTHQCYTVWATEGNR